MATTTVLDLADLASEQWGLLTSAQATRHGATHQAIARLTNQGRLERVSHGVYRIAGSPPEPLDDLRAAWLSLSPQQAARQRLNESAPAVVSHRSAALLHRLGDLDADVFEFTTLARKQSRNTEIRLHRRQYGPQDWTIVDGLPVTSVLRTVADLAAARTDGGHLAAVVRDALTVKQVDDDALAGALAAYAHHYGASVGDGAGLLSRFLQEAGVSVPLSRAVEIATSPALDRAAAKALANISTSPAFGHLLDEVSFRQTNRIQELLKNAMSPLVEAQVRQFQEIMKNATSPALGAATANPRIQELLKNATTPVLEATTAQIQEIMKNATSSALGPAITNARVHEMVKDASIPLLEATKAAQLTKPETRAKQAPAAKKPRKFNQKGRE